MSKFSKNIEQSVLKLFSNKKLKTILQLSSKIIILTHFEYYKKVSRQNLLRKLILS